MTTVTSVCFYFGDFRISSCFAMGSDSTAVKNLGSQKKTHKKKIVAVKLGATGVKARGRRGIDS